MVSGIFSTYGIRGSDQSDLGPFDQTFCTLVRYAKVLAALVRPFAHTGWSVRDGADGDKHCCDSSAALRRYLTIKGLIVLTEQG